MFRSSPAHTLIPHQDVGVQVPIADICGRCLDGFGYDHTKPTHGKIGFFLVTEPQTERWAEFRIDEDAGLLRLFVMLINSCPPPLLQRVTELAARVNETVVMGAVVSGESGACWYRSHVDFRDREAGVQEVENLLNASAYPIQLWNEGCKLLLKHPEASPAEVIEAALLATDALDDDEVNAAAVKLLLSVESGGGAGCDDPVGPPQVSAM